MERLRSAPPGLLAGAVAAALLAVAYPFAVAFALEQAGPRAVAAPLLAAAAALLVVGRGRAPAPVRAAQLASVALLALAAATDDRRPLLVLPAAGLLGAAGVFLASVREPVSLVHRVARWMKPVAPDWIGPYCRVVTVLWSGFLAGNAILVAALAAAGAVDAWARWCGLGIWVTATALQAGEFVFRKAWFRYYPGDPLDPFFAALLPADRTARGRRSTEYIRRARSRA